jgi:hypothetical protein
MKKEYINILSIIVILFISVKILKLNQEHFTDLKKIQSLYGDTGDQGPQGLKGLPGSIGDDGIGHEQNVFLNTTLNLGKKSTLSIPLDKDDNSYSQLTLSREVSSNGVKLRIDKDEYERNYSIFCQDNNNTTDFYINNKEMVVNGDVELDSIILNVNNETRRIPDDLFPLGTIFPFYMEPTSVPTSGYYTVTLGGEHMYYTTESPATITTTGGAATTTTGGAATTPARPGFTITPNQDIKIMTHTIYVEQNNNYTVYLRFMKSATELYYLSVKDDDSLEFITVPDKSCEFKFIGGTAIMSVTNNKFLANDGGEMKCTANDDTNKFDFTIKVPPGWIECNGEYTSYTHGDFPITIPDLRDRFILHKSNDFYFNKSHNSDVNIALLTDNLPEHAHTMNIGGVHNHDISGGADGSHHHTLNKTISNNEGNNFGSGGFDGNITKQNTNIAGGHKHQFKMNKNAAHGDAHPINQSGYPQPATINIMPPYYKIVYIMKVLDYDNITPGNPIPIVTLPAVSNPTHTPTTTQSINDVGAVETKQFKSIINYNGILIGLGVYPRKIYQIKNNKYDNLEEYSSNNFTYLYTFGGVLFGSDGGLLKYFNNGSPLSYTAYPNAKGIVVMSDGTRYILKVNDIYKIETGTFNLRRYYVVKGGWGWRTHIMLSPPANDSPWKQIFSFYAFDSPQPGTTEYFVWKRSLPEDAVKKIQRINPGPHGPADEYSLDFKFYSYTSYVIGSTRFGISQHVQGDTTWHQSNVLENGGAEQFYAFLTPTINKREVNLTGNTSINFVNITQIDGELIGITNNSKVYKINGIGNIELYTVNGNIVSGVKSIAKHNTHIYGIDNNNRLTTWNGLSWV